MLCCCKKKKRRRRRRRRTRRIPAPKVVEFNARFVAEGSSEEIELGSAGSALRRLPSTEQQVNKNT
jgi:hypothetical protein